MQQLRYVTTELGQGLRRNLSMHLAVILTLMVSLALVGVGLLLHSEAGLTKAQFGNKVQLTIYLCNGGDTDENPGCNAAVNPAQKTQITSELDQLKASGQVTGYTYETQQQAFDRLKQLGSIPASATGSSGVIQAKDLWETYWVQLSDPSKASDVSGAVGHLDGVDHVLNQLNLITEILSAIDKLQKGAIVAAVILVIAALLLVSNTIRLAAIARRREIGIMRLVGASTLYIALPFLLEAVFTAIVGIVLGCAALGTAMWFGVLHHGVASLHWNQWVGWSQFWTTCVWLALLGLVLTLLPTLLLTRKYLKV
jgi:cell division transport system permease protein